MAEVKISQLPAAAAVSLTDQLEANQGGVSRSLTLAQISAIGGTPLLNTAALAALTTRPLVAFTQGYATANDGGGGIWIWYAGDVTPADTGMIVSPTGTPTGRYRRMFWGSDALALWYGVKPDNLSDNATTLQGALNAANANGLNLLLPAGTCKIGTTLNHSGAAIIRGAALASTVLVPLADSIGTLVSITGPGRLTDMKLDGSAIPTPSFQHVALNTTGLAQLADLVILGGAKAIYFPQGNDTKITRVRMQGQTVACIHSGGVSGIYPGDTTYRDCVGLPTSAGIGYICDGNSNAQRFHHFVVAGGLNAVLLRGTGGNMLPDGVSFQDGCNFTQTVGPVIRILKAQNTQFQGGYVGGSTGDCGIEIAAAADADVDAVQIEGLVVRANAKEGVRWTGGANLKFQGGASHGNGQGGSYSNFYIGASARGLLHIEGVMAGMSKSGEVYANIAGPAKYGIELAAGALTDVTNFPGRKIIVGNMLRGNTLGSILDQSAPAPANSTLADNLIDPTPQLWTPALNFGGAATGITYAARSGTWQQIGQYVQYSAVIQLSSKGTATGAATISGLPVNVGNYAGQVSIPYYGNMATLSAPAGYCGTGNGVITLTNAAATAHAAMTNTNFTNTSVLYLAGSFNIN